MNRNVTCVKLRGGDVRLLGGGAGLLGGNVGVAKVLNTKLWKKSGKSWGKPCGLLVGKDAKKSFSESFKQVKGGKDELYTSFWTSFSERFTQDFKWDFPLLGGEFSTFST